jgi:hypothetical protein
MKKLLHTLACFLFALCFVTVAAAQTWKPVGPDENDQPSISDTFHDNVVIAPDGTPYIAYMDESIGGAVVVKKFNGTTWEVVGNAGIYNNYSSNVSLAIAPDGTLYVSFLSAPIGTLTPVLNVFKFNGSAWADIKPFKNMLAVYLSIAAGPDGALYLSYAGAGVSPAATVYKYYGGSWSMLNPTGGNISTSTGSSFIKLCVAADGTIYLCYADAAKNSKFTVKKYSNSAWSSVGTEGFGPSAVAELNMALAPDGTPYVAFPDAANSNKLSVLKYDGLSSWVSVGVAGSITVGAAAGERIAIAKDGTPMIISIDLGAGKQVIGKMYKNNSWTNIGSGVISTQGTSLAKTGNDYFNGFALSPTDGTPYVIYRDSLLTSKAVVKKFINNNWVYVGQAPTPDGVGMFNFKLDANDVPYIAYTDAADSYKAYVRKYTGGSWQVVGSSLSQAKSNSIGIFADVALAPNGTPYAVYTDILNGNYAAYVKSFNGTAWVPVGTNGLVAGSVWFNRIFIAPDGTPYVIYTDGGFLLSVKKYTGGTWVQVGNAAFTNAYNNVQLAFASDGTIYAACENGGSYNNYTGYVYKLVNNVWQNLNVPNVPYSWTLHFSLAVAPDNTPYVSYSDLSNGSPVTIQKFNGTGWTYVPQSGAPAGFGAISNLTVAADGSITIAVDSTGSTPWNTYHVMKLKSGVWANVGTGRQIPYYGSPIVLALPKTGEVMLGYQNGQVFVTQSTPDVAVATLAPTITSFSPTVAGAGDTVIIKGTNFHTLASYSGVKSLSFGGQSTSGYLVNSDKQITAIIGSGATGSVSVSTFNGTATVAGFTYAPTPYVRYTGSTTINSGDSVVFTASPSNSPGYYQWYLNDKAITGANSNTYVAYNAGIYTVSITTLGLVKKSPYGAYVTVNFTPPIQNFNITITGETCKGATNGSIVAGINYNIYGPSTYYATLTANGVNLNKAIIYGGPVTFSNLVAGTYNLCFTSPSIPGYQQCQTVVIVEPKDITAYTVGIGSNNKTVTLKLGGGSIYNIQLNGTLYSTKDSTITLPIAAGNNHLIITTDKACQGIIDETINASDNAMPYPNPFDNVLYLNLGNQKTSMATVEIYSGQGAVVYKKQFLAPANTINLDTGGIIIPGLYILKLTTDDGMQHAFKIIKK